MPKEFPDRVVICDHAAVSVQPFGKSVGISFIDSDGQQVLLAMHGALLRGLSQEVDNALQTVPDIVNWPAAEPKR